MINFSQIRNYIRGGGRVSGGEILQKFAHGGIRASDVMLALLTLENTNQVNVYREPNRIVYSL